MGQCLIEPGPYGLPEFVREADRGVVVEYRLLDRVDVEVWRTAHSLLPSPAEEVVVLAAVAPGPLHDEPVLAPRAPQHALQVVVVGARPGSGSRMGVEHLLYPLEQFRRDERLVPARILDA